MPATWAWDSTVWGQPITDPAGTWGYVQDVYVPLDQNLQRLILRTSYTDWVDEVRDDGVIKPATGEVTLGLAVGSDGAGLEDLHFAAHSQQWLGGWTSTDVLLFKTYWTGLVAPFDLDMLARRTNGPDRDTQTHIQVSEAYFADNFSDDSFFPRWYTTGELRWLTSTPGSSSTSAALAGLRSVAEVTRRPMTVDELDRLAGAGHRRQPAGSLADHPAD